MGDLFLGDFFPVGFVPGGFFPVGFVPRGFFPVGFVPGGFFPRPVTSIIYELVYIHFTEKYGNLGTLSPLSNECILIEKFTIFCREINSIWTLLSTNAVLGLFYIIAFLRVR